MRDVEDPVGVEFFFDEAEEVGVPDEFPVRFDADAIVFDSVGFFAVLGEN